MNSQTVDLSVKDVLVVYQSLRAQGCAASDASVQLERYGDQMPRTQWQRVQKAIREFEIQANWDELYV